MTALIANILRHLRSHGQHIGPIKLVEKLKTRLIRIGNRSDTVSLPMLLI